MASEGPAGSKWRAKPRAVRPETRYTTAAYSSRSSTPSGWWRRSRAFGGRRPHSYDSAVAETIKRSPEGRDYPSARAMASSEVVEFARLAWAALRSPNGPPTNPGWFTVNKIQEGRPPTVDRLNKHLAQSAAYLTPPEIGQDSGKSRECAAARRRETNIS
jgi:hypothetical protein